MHKNIKKQDIIRLIRSKKIGPQTREQIARHFEKSGGKRKAVNRLLDRMESEAEIIRVKKGRYAVPSDLGLVVGKLEVKPRGFGFVIPAEGGGDVYINGENMSTAIDGDTVLVRVVEGRRRGGKSRSGKIIRVLKRNKEKIVGILEKRKSIFYLLPDNPAIVHDLYIDPEDTAGARPGDKVTARITSWPSRHLSPEGEVVEVLGRAGLPEVDTLAAIRQFDLRQDYPDDVLQAAEAAPDRVKPAARAGRKDLRDLILFTIDPDDARDFDDAVSLEKTEEGNWRLGVHIADVSHYLPAAGALEREARQRGTTVYLPARALHMIPPRLSTGILSLRPDEERLTKSAFITYDPEGKRIGYRFYRSVIRSRRRFTYGRVRQILIDKDAAARREAGELTGILDRMAALARKLRRARFDRGALDLDMPEAKIIFDKRGLIKDVELEEQDLAHWLIEEFMLAANEAAADFLTRKKAPLIYRIHEEPDDEDLAEFMEFVAAFGYRITNPRDRKEIQRFLDSVKQTPLATSLQTAFLRSLKRAEYSEKNLGHYGLASPCYAYFTSPIRRYPDLHTHRLLDHALTGKKFPKFPALKGLALHCSETENVADDAEREMLKLRKLQYFQRQRGRDESAVFRAVITRVMKFGLMVYLNRYLLTGLVHVSSLTDDFYKIDRSGTKLKGRRKKKEYRVGDVIKVRVEKVDLIKKEIDFIIFSSKK